MTWKERLHLGTSGFSYDDWREVFYPDNLPKNLMLSFYSEVFETVEIDSSFYHMPRASSVVNWAKSTPRNFKFSAKIPKEISHKRLPDTSASFQDVLDDFVSIMSNLGSKLGPLLLQLPPKFDASLIDRLESFFTIFPFNAANLAVEFRNLSWLDLGSKLWSLLENYNVAYCIVEEPLLPSISTVTSTDFSYIRWHGHAEKPWWYYRFSEDELKAWLPKLETVADEVPTVYGYFNNHFGGRAPTNLLQLKKLLKTPTQDPKSVDVPKLLRKARKNGSSSLSKFFKE